MLFFAFSRGETSLKTQDIGKNHWKKTYNLKLPHSEDRLEITLPLAEIGEFLRERSFMVQETVHQPSIIIKFMIEPDHHIKVGVCFERMQFCKFRSQSVNIFLNHRNAFFNVIVFLLIFLDKVAVCHSWGVCSVGSTSKKFD